MSKTAKIVVLIVAPAVLLTAGAAFVVYHRLGLYMDACRDHARQSLRESRIRNRAAKERKAELTSELEKKGALVRLNIESDDSGRIVLKADERVFGTVRNASGKELPDYRALYDFLVRKKGEVEPSPGSTGMKVIIDASSDVDFKYVINALNECVRAGIEDIEFAAEKGPLDDCFEEKKVEGDTHKQK